MRQKATGSDVNSASRISITPQEQDRFGLNRFTNEATRPKREHPCYMLRVRFTLRMKAEVPLAETIAL